MDSWGALFVIANIVRGSRKELVKEKVMGELCKELSDPDRCRVRKVRHFNLILHTSLVNMIYCTGCPRKKYQAEFQR